MRDRRAWPVRQKVVCGATGRRDEEGGGRKRDCGMPQRGALQRGRAHNTPTRSARGAAYVDALCRSWRDYYHRGAWGVLPTAKFNNRFPEIGSRADVLCLSPSLFRQKSTTRRRRSSRDFYTFLPSSLDQARSSKILGVIRSMRKNYLSIHFPKFYRCRRIVVSTHVYNYDLLRTSGFPRQSSEICVGASNLSQRGIAVDAKLDSRNKSEGANV